MKAWLAVLLWVGAALANTVAAQEVPAIERELPPGLQIPAAARPGPDFDVERATQAYLALLTPEQRAKSDAYFEGDYVLSVVDLAYGLAAAALILWSGWSRRMREFAQRITRRPFLVALLYAVGWIATMFVLNLPWASYTGFVREHAYGLATQSYGAWFGDHLKGLGVSMVLGAPVIALIYAAVRRAGRAWWAWAGGITLLFVMFGAMIAPVYISPLFNQYQPLAAGPLARIDPVAGARQPRAGRGGLPVRRLAPDHAHQRQRLGDVRHHPRVAQRQSAQAHVGRRDPCGDGP